MERRQEDKREEENRKNKKEEEREENEEDGKEEEDNLDNLEYNKHIWLSLINANSCVNTIANEFFLLITLISMLIKQMRVYILINYRKLMKNIEMQ